MLNNYIIYKDNFLDDEHFKYLQNKMLDEYFPWYFNSSRTYSNDNNYQFTHTFFKDGQVQSELFYILEKFLEKIDIKALIRVKANLTLPTREIENGLFHVDTTFKCKTGLLYLNTNDGKTLFKNFSVNSIENRFVTFPTLLEHSGTSHTNVNRRVVINVNYF